MRLSRTAMLKGLGAHRTDPLHAAFVLAVATGLRRGETVGLRWSDVAPENRVLYVRQQTQSRMPGTAAPR